MSHKKHLVLDIGNTHIKYGYFENEVILTSGVCSTWTAEQWDIFHQEYPFTHVLIGSVGVSSKHVASLLPKTCSIHVVDESTRYPFTSAYNTIHALGIDRRAALAGAMRLYPNTSVLIIDAGSCITYDYINDKGHHEGGAISPGREMRYHAMHLLTAKLPFVNPVDVIPAIGTTTETSMQLGVEQGIVAEIQAQIDLFQQRFKNFTIILTGGDAYFLIKKIKNAIFAHADLTLVGLHFLLMYNMIHEE